MRRRPSLLFLLLFTLIFAAAPERSLFARPHFVPPSVLTATDIPYPFASIALGIVTVTVNLSATGQIQGMQVLRDIPSLTGPAEASINQWTFSPGKLDGTPVASSINISVIFNPATLQTQNLTVPPPQPAPPPNPPGYLPPEISAASYASYPMNSIATGTVVLSVLVGDSDQIRKVLPIRPVASLTSQAVATVNNWSFNSGTINGKSVNSSIVIAFVFRPPNASP
jgi:outer membrane biosynthesis protein TonB